MDTRKKKRLQLAWFATVIVAMVVLIVLQYYGFTQYNRAGAYRESRFLISETEKIIAGNDVDRNELQRFVERENMEKARIVAKFIDAQPEIEQDPVRLRELAQTIGVDQIHLFTSEGIIYSGTHEDYYGLSIEAGEQIRFFLPMLEDRSLALSQGVSTNTKEGKIMLYSMCWNEEKTHMVQVGTYGERFPRLLNRNRIDEFMDLVPNDSTTEIILTDAGKNLIVASSNRELVGRNLENLGISTEQEPTEKQRDFKTGFSHNPIYCSCKQHQEYNIYIAHYKNKLNDNIPVTLFTFAEYLILVFIAMSFIIDYYYDKFTQAKTYAIKDKLTGLFNRRAYEVDVTEMENRPMDKDLVIVSMDVNGLKTVNDNLGHQAGDTLLKGAADCIQKCYEPFGRVYRFGGDEFAAIILAKGVEIEPLRQYLDQLCSLWSEENHMEMSISAGFSRSADHPDAVIRALEAMADQAMYAEKARHYAQTGYDRRRVTHESK